MIENAEKLKELIDIYNYINEIRVCLIIIAICSAFALLCSFAIFMYFMNKEEK